ncbi:MAG: lysophospholipid acyltransferase family protein [Microscillaceae bacterium]|nr:lysophospholipid acyltransferase family protein [Microscillaceae bacterium]MDW8460973.1 lysophospholipid acyltransferase family protein [Cytophagales bacterium]
MKALLYKILFTFLYLLSLLPFWCLHRLADFLFLFIFYLINYRKEVVEANLARAFPEKSPAERKKIMRTYYLHLCDLIVETIKTQTISQKALAQRLHTPNIDFLLAKIAQGESIMVLTSHVGNWEWHLALVPILKLHTFAIYQPLSNPYFDAYIRKMRSRFQAQMVSMQQIPKLLLEAHQSQKQHISWFAADQAPKPKTAFWTTFLHQDTPFHTGYEKLAMRLNCAVVYFYLRKTGRSRYKLEILPMREPNQPLQEGQLVSQYVKILEKQIQENAPYWLWSHKRWKYARPNNKN